MRFAIEVTRDAMSVCGHAVGHCKRRIGDGPLAVYTYASEANADAERDRLKGNARSPNLSYRVVPHDGGVPRGTDRARQIPESTICVDCGEPGEVAGHMSCESPQDHDMGPEPLDPHGPWGAP